MDTVKAKKIANKVFWKIFLVLLIGFTAIYISEVTGYYEFEQHNKKVLTEQQIKQFEKDVAEGKNVDINEYINHEQVNYSNKLSKLGLNISTGLEDIIVSGLESTFKFLNGVLG